MKVSHKVQWFTESVIREMTRLALEHRAVNLAQGFPDLAVPEEVKEAAVRAISAPTSTSTPSPGARVSSDGPLLSASRRIRDSRWIPSARLQSAAAPPRP